MKTRKQLLHRNWLGKQGFEDWGDFLGRNLRQAICKVFGHSKPIMQMDAGPKGICSRCRMCL